MPGKKRPQDKKELKKKRLFLRARIIDSIRNYFREQDFLEVQTPVLIKEPIPESSIESFFLDPGGNNPRLYLAPSPEVNMKRLLSEGLDKIFQIGPVFRKDERGNLHLPEFTLLEWYRSHADYNALMKDCEEIFQSVAQALDIKDSKVFYQRNVLDITPPFHSITVKDAFREYAGWEPGPGADPDRFNHDLVFKVEPALPKKYPVFLKDYPAPFASLARLKPDDSTVAERVELYACGIELANGFSELTDPDEQAERFEYENRKRKEQGLNQYPKPTMFLEALKNLPECAGMALGVDRLVMLFTDAESIDDVVAFAE